MWHYRGKPGRALQYAHSYRGMFYRTSKQPIRRGRRAACSPTIQGSALFSSMRELKVRTERFLRGKLSRATAHFLLAS